MSDNEKTVQPETFDIAAAPRNVPAGIRRRLLVGGPFNLSGWLSLGLGLVLCWIFLRNSELRTYIDFIGHTEFAQGQVVAIEETNASENDARIYAIRYVFDIDGREYGGTSYASHTNFDAGETVSIEYLTSDPAISRINGMRRYKFSSGIALVLIVPVIGVGLAAFGFVRGRRKLHILRNGRPALGTLVSKRATKVTVNEKPVYELSFEFQDHDGYTHTVRVKTAEPGPLEDDATERLLYLPGKPPAIVLMDELAQARVSGDGQLVATDSGVVAMIPPVVCGLVVVVLIALSLAG